ncbi:unnamed protein product [Discula destructiva]
MDGNMQQRSRSSDMSPKNDDSDPDSISITSTVGPEDPSDTEYVVEDVHAEGEKEVDGERKKVFLVEWANFPLDECTWEPLDNLSAELADQWEEKKATHDPSVAKEFEEKYEAAYKVALEAARQLHRRRNAKRRRKGKPTTGFYFRGNKQSDSEDDVGLVEEDPDSESEPSGDSDNDGDLDEAEEENVVDHRATAALEKSKSSSEAKMLKASRPPNRVFTYQVDQTLSTRTHAEKTTANGKRTDSHPSHSSKTPTGSGGPKQDQRQKASKRASRDRELPSRTGYQGSAQRSSAGDLATRPIEPVKTKSSNIKPALSRSVRPGTLDAIASAGTATSAKVPRPGSASAAASLQVADKAPLTGRKSVGKKSSNLPVDIFAAGKKPRSRTGIGEIEVNPDREGKLYSRVNQKRKSELRSRERDDQGPPIHKVAPALFAPGSLAKKTQPGQQEQASRDLDESEGTRSQEVKQKPLAQQEQSSTGLDHSEVEPMESAEDPQEQRSTAPSLQVAGSSNRGLAVASTNPVQGTKRKSTLISVADRSNKKAKTVRFTGVEFEPSTMQEPSTFQHSSTLFGERLPTQEEKEEKEEEESPMEGSTKITEDGGLFVDDADSPRGLPICPSTPSESGLTKSSAGTYRTNKGQSVSKKIKLSTSPTSILDVTFDSIPTSDISDADQQWLHDFLGTDCLDVGHMFLAESLITRVPTLAEFRPLCAGLVSSDNGADSLEVVADHLRVGSSGLFLAQAQFNLVLFPTKCAEFEKLIDFGGEPTSPENVALKYLMFSSATPIFRLMRPSSNTVEGLQAFVGKEKLLLFPTILGMQFSQLIAPSDKNKKKLWHFYLAFPQRAIEWHNSIGSWLSIRDPTCNIYTNFDSGSWRAFLEVVRRERGVVIIHEALVPFIRRFHHIHKLLIKTPIAFWQFTESMDFNPPRPLVSLDIVPVLSTRFSRMFPIGSVILVTPSFLVTEPQEAYKLLKWFFDARAKFPRNKLVVAHNIVEYLSDLSGQKIDLRARLEHTLWKQKRPLNVAMDKNSAALTDEDLAARQKTWFYMDWWLSQQVDRDIPYSENNSVIFADRSIDPNDEQSLVNWFGWWSMAHIQDYRKFYVVGSSSKLPTVEYTLTSRSCRKINIPRYDRSVVNDPDEATRIALRKSGNLKTQNESQTPDFQSICFQDDENQMRPWLTDRDRSWFQFLYNNPVSWADAEMADHFDDSAMHFATIKQWWDSLPPWTAKQNTHAAFFYTISEEWHPESFPRGIKPRRHPWLAIWRPADCHKPELLLQGRTELIIWDVRAGDELEGNHTLRLQDLTWMQRALVEHIQNHAHEKNPHSYLERVWMGGFEAQRAGLVSTLPVDTTAEFILNHMMPNLFNTLPAAKFHMHGLNYRQVLMLSENRPSSARTEEQSKTELGFGDDNDPDTRIIFHPPRGSEVLKPDTSKCTNSLYEASRLARLRNPHVKETIFTYPPTMTWYQQQMTEGRHFEHIMVAEWEKVFQAMQVGTDRSASLSQSATSERAPQKPSRSGSFGSVSSNHSSSTY